MDYTAWLLREYMENSTLTQRSLAKRLGMSLGSAHALLADAERRGLIVPVSHALTPAGHSYLTPYQVDGAVILAAGFGSRFVPLTYETPKGLLRVRGERMIERQIRQLREAGIRDITLVVGYLKERFDYLIDRFGVKLLYNPDYETKNNLSSVYYARHLFRGRNVYLLSSDNWMRDNMYHSYEPGAWYSAVYQAGETGEWVIRCDRKNRISDVRIGGRDSLVMYGPVYFSREFSEAFLPELEQAFSEPGTEQYYWENVYLDLLHGVRGSGNVPPLFVNRQPADQVYEFENLEELRLFDPSYRDHSDNAAMELLARVFHIPESGIHHIRRVKAGMTNQSFLFMVENRDYICRIPGAGTRRLLNRKQEYQVYQTIAPLDISDEIIYFDPETGYKISTYYQGMRNADPDSEADLIRCMALLRRLHASGLRVEHSFDLGERISFHEALCREQGEIPFEDYRQVSRNMQELLRFLETLRRPRVLTHIDPNIDNFVLSEQEIRLLDWEYAAMADPLLDVSMNAIYSRYDLDRAIRLLSLYLQREPDETEKLVVWSYMALGGFLWSLWAVYKEQLGKNLGDYTLFMYRYAKDGYRRVLASNVRNY